MRGVVQSRIRKGFFLSRVKVGDERGDDGGFGQLCLVLGLQNLGSLQIQTDGIDYHISHPIEKAIMVR